MNTLLEPIFTSFRAYPNGANSLEQAIDKGFHYCQQAMQQFVEGHGLMVQLYAPGLWTDKSEKNIHYQLTMAQADVARGFCTCTVESPAARVLFGGGILPVKRRIEVIGFLAYNNG